MSDNYRLLLERVARLYERHETGHRPPFNIFSVLRSESDEVNLHSRFLHALLNYRKPGEEARENLKDFLEHVGIKDFEECGAAVERERDNIDILITDADKKKAVVIENKIWAGDQSEQLQRYHKTLKKRRYSNIRLLYLTPSGREPSKESVGDLPYESISYKDHLPLWLKRCQQRAYDEPELRESVAQYLQLVQKLTGTDLKGEYMNALRDLCLQDNNLVLAHDLHEGMVEAEALLLKKLWDEIEEALEKLDLPDKDNELSNTSLEMIKNFLINAKNSKRRGLYYGNEARKAWLCVSFEDDNRIFLGVRCHRDNRKECNELDQVLEAVPGRKSDKHEWWRWWRHHGKLDLKNPTRENLELLSNEKTRQEYVQNIAEDLGRVWNVLKDFWG